VENKMELAAIKIGGKQYLISPGQKIKIEKIDKKEGEEIVFSEVLLLQKGEKLKIGKPLVEGAKVIGKILGEKKEKKIVILKHRPRSSYKVKKGHRQIYTIVEISNLQFPNSK
jgi:large subunit ribosomal protein L21